MKNNRYQILMEEGSARCPFCGQFIFSGDLEDDSSVQEFIISGLCQECQNNTFR